jgi:hypothetical protein
MRRYGTQHCLTSGGCDDYCSASDLLFFISLAEMCYSFLNLLPFHLSAILIIPTLTPSHFIHLSRLGLAALLQARPHHRPARAHPRLERVLRLSRCLYSRNHFQRQWKKRG